MSFTTKRFKKVVYNIILADFDQNVNKKENNIYDLINN